jgi:hypothetical protein
VPADKSEEVKPQDPRAELQKHAELQLHGILAAGWDQVNDGWMLECVCNWMSGVSMLMEVVGIEFDNHLRTKGILNDSKQSNRC